MTYPVRINIAPYAPDDAYSYALFIADLIRLMHIKEGCQWTIGDALQGLETKYEERTIQNIADDIGASASSLYNWRDLSGFFVPVIREHYKALGLMYSHFREAFKLGSIDAAYTFLDECVALKWTTVQAAIEVRLRKGYAAAPPPVFKGELTFEIRGSQVFVSGLEGVQMKANQRYKVTINEV